MLSKYSKVLRATATGAGCLLGAGCVSTIPPSPDDIVPVPVVITTIKCELAQYLTNELANDDRLRVRGGKIDATLELNVVDSRTAGVNISGPGLLALSAVSVSPTFGYSQTAKRTVKTVMVLNFTASAEDVLACDEKERLQNGLGIFAWLGSTSQQIREMAPRQPHAKVGGMTYETTFGIKKTTTGSTQAAYTFVPLSVTPSGSLDLDTTQKVTLIFKPAAQGTPARPSRPDKPGDFEFFIIGDVITQ